jgi:CRP-like cAMP-binding protein
MLAASRVLPFAEGEIIQGHNTIPEAMCFIAEGTAGMYAVTPDGAQVPIGDIGPGDFIGGSALTKQKMSVGVRATSDSVLIAVSNDAMSSIVQQSPRLARQIGDAVEIRRQAAREAIAQAVQHGAA